MSHVTSKQGQDRELWQVCAHNNTNVQINGVCFVRKRAEATQTLMRVTAASLETARAGREMLTIIDSVIVFVYEACVYFHNKCRDAGV